MPPTRLERWIGARVNLRICGKWLGTGHWRADDTDSEESESDFE